MLFSPERNGKVWINSSIFSTLKVRRYFQHFFPMWCCKEVLLQNVLPSEKLTKRTHHTRSKSFGKIKLTLNLSTEKGRYKKCVYLFKLTFFCQIIRISAARSCHISLDIWYSHIFCPWLSPQKRSNSSYIALLEIVYVHYVPLRTLVAFGTYSTTLLVTWSIPKDKKFRFFLYHTHTHSVFNPVLCSMHSRL